MTQQIAFIGFGEAGQTISRGLREEGVTGMRAYDILFDDPADKRGLKPFGKQIFFVPGLFRAAAMRG